MFLEVRRGGGLLYIVYPGTLLPPIVDIIDLLYRLDLGTLLPPIVDIRYILYRLDMGTLLDPIVDIIDLTITCSWK